MKKSKLLFLLILILAAFLRFSSLGADPSVLLDSGQVGDEGYWLYNARNLALFHQTARDDFYHDFAAAPVFSFTAYLSFLTFGVGFWQARLVSAVAGFLTVLATYAIAKPLGSKVAKLSALLAALNTLLLLHNRLAVGESLSILFLMVTIYFWNKKKFAAAGVTFALGFLAKTTAILYIPSFGLLIAAGAWSRRRVNFRPAMETLVATAVTLLIVSLPLFFLWRDKIILIYTSFGSWLAPGGGHQVFQNIYNFTLHPFWGSPFIFSIVILALVNILNYVSGEHLDEKRRNLILWVIGILFFGPFISRITNARFLGLIVPLSILAAQSAVQPKFLRIDVKNIEKKVKSSKWLLYVAIPLLVAAPSVIFAKATLAAAKRLLGDQTLVNNLPLVSVVIFLIMAAIVIFFNKKLFYNLLKINIGFLLALPLMSFVAVGVGYLSFFEIINPISTTVISIFEILVFLAFYLYLVQSKFDLSKRARFFILLFFLLNIFGISTILVKPSKNIAVASEQLGQIAERSVIIGFYGHELSLGNGITPIYWAPRLQAVGGVNSNYQMYEPGYLLVARVFDSQNHVRSDWPEVSDINRSTIYIESLNLSREFLAAKREFILDVYRIDN